MPGVSTTTYGRTCLRGDNAAACRRAATDSRRREGMVGSRNNSGNTRLMTDGFPAVRHARRNSRCLRYVNRAVLVANEIGSADMCPDAQRRLDARAAGPEILRRVNDLRGHAAVADEFLVVVDIVDEQIERSGPLDQPFFDALPLLARDGAREYVKRPGAIDRAVLLVIDRERDAHGADRQFRGLLPDRNFGAAEFRQISQQRASRGASAAPGPTVHRAVRQWGTWTSGFHRMVVSVATYQVQSLRSNWSTPLPPDGASARILRLFGASGSWCAQSIIAACLFTSRSTRYPLPLRPADNVGPRPSGCGRRPIAATRILSYSLKVTPADSLRELGRIRSRIISRAAYSKEDTRTACREVDLVAEMSVFNPFDFFTRTQAEQLRLPTLSAAP